MQLTSSCTLRVPITVGNCAIFRRFQYTSTTRLSDLGWGICGGNACCCRRDSENHLPSLLERIDFVNSGLEDSVTTVAGAFDPGPPSGERARKRRCSIGHLFRNLLPGKRLRHSTSGNIGGERPISRTSLLVRSKVVIRELADIQCGLASHSLRTETNQAAAGARTTSSIWESLPGNPLQRACALRPAGERRRPPANVAPCVDPAQQGRSRQADRGAGRTVSHRGKTGVAPV